MKVGVIGCGSIGRRYVRWLAEMGATVGVYDNDPKQTSAVGSSEARIFKDTSELYRWGVDKVLVATPPKHHAAYAMQAMDAGADLLIEKPLATTLEDAAAIAAKSTALGRPAWVVCNMRFHPAIQLVRRRLPETGRPLCFNSHFSHRLSQMRPAGTKVYAGSAKDGGGVVLDCIHEFDYLRWLLGDVKRVRGLSGKISDQDIDAADVADIQLQLKNGCNGTLHLDFISRWKLRGFQLIGSESTLIWRSCGRSPEQSEVLIGNQNGSQVISRSDSIDPGSPYQEMLRRFLADGEGLQTVTDACAVLRTALSALSEDWIEI